MSPTLILAALLVVAAVAVVALIARPWLPSKNDALAAIRDQADNARGPYLEQLRNFDVEGLLGVHRRVIGTAAMVVTLEQAKKLTTDDVDLQVIDEFGKSSFLLGALPFDDVVTPSGPTMTYGYHRLATQVGADFRAINSEYTPSEVTTVRVTTDLKPLGGSFQIDRVLARLGGAAPAVVSNIELQMSQKIKGTQARFADEVINGDVAVDTKGFDGLNKALVGTTTEKGVGVVQDWRGTALGSDKGLANNAIDLLEEWLASLDGRADAIMGNRQGLSVLKSMARRADYLDKSTTTFGLQVSTYNGIPLVDLGERAGSSAMVIPTVSKTVATVAGSYTDLYAVRFGLDGLKGVAMAGAPLVQTWLPDFSTAGAVKTGEVEMGPVSIALMATKAAGVLRNVRVG